MLLFSSQFRVPASARTRVRALVRYSGQPRRSQYAGALRLILAPTNGLIVHATSRPAGHVFRLAFLNLPSVVRPKLVALGTQRSPASLVANRTRIWSACVSA